MSFPFLNSRSGRPEKGVGTQPGINPALASRLEMSRRAFLRKATKGVGAAALLGSMPRAWLGDVQASDKPPTRTAVIGDFGVDSQEELGVSKMIKNLLKPDVIVTTGDNNYGLASEIDQNIGKYYHEYIGNYRGRFGEGAATNRFFPAIGNHDWLESGGYKTHLNYFTLGSGIGSGILNERYYDFVQGPIHWFICSSEDNEPDGRMADSKQGRWMASRIKASTAPWKLAVIHDPPYSSGSGMNDETQWPFKEWGIHAVFSGDSHNYERLNVKGFPYFVNGAGGQGIGGWYRVLQESVVRDSTNNGAMLVEADTTRITFQFYAVKNGGTLMDSLTLKKQLPGLNIAHAPADNATVISWNTNATGYDLEETADPLDPASWSRCSTDCVVVGSQNIVKLSGAEGKKFFRLRHR